MVGERNLLTTNGSARQCTALLVGVEDSLVDVGPKLFVEEVEAVDDVAGEPLLSDLGPGAVFGGVVQAGDSGCSAGADDFGEVEGCISVIFTRDEDAGDGIEAAFAEAAVTESVKAVVLFEDDGPETADHKVFVDCVGECVPVVATVACDTLMEFWV